LVSGHVDSFSPAFAQSISQLRQGGGKGREEKGRREGRDRNKGRRGMGRLIFAARGWKGEGGDGGRFAARGWKGQGRKERERGMGN